MNLRKITFLVILTLCVSLAARFVGTLWPEIFSNLVAARVAAVLYLLSGLCMFLFYVVFSRERARADESNLRNAASLAAGGAVGMVLVHLKGTASLFDVAAARDSILAWPFGEIVFPLVASVTALYFFVVYRRSIARRGVHALGKAAVSAIIGCSVLILMHLFTMVNYAMTGRFRWVSEHTGSVTLVAAPFVLGAALAILYFFLTLYRSDEW